MHHYTRWADLAEKSIPPKKFQKFVDSMEFGQNMGVVPSKTYRGWQVETEFN
jgi:hypothetical protein